MFTVHDLGLRVQRVQVSHRCSHAFPPLIEKESIIIIKMVAAYAYPILKLIFLVTFSLITRHPPPWNPTGSLYMPYLRPRLYRKRPRRADAEHRRKPEMLHWPFTPVY